MKAKYITVMNDGVPCAIVFDPILVHRDVAQAFRLPVLGAGFVELKVTPVVGGGVADFIAHGESESLGVKSQGEEDSRLIRRAFGYRLP
jgi:hypothetical protein